jgi:hypothetical protein
MDSQDAIEMGKINHTESSHHVRGSIERGTQRNSGFDIAERLSIVSTHTQEDDNCKLGFQILKRRIQSSREDEGTLKVVNGSTLILFQSVYPTFCHKLFIYELCLNLCQPWIGIFPFSRPVMHSSFRLSTANFMIAIAWLNIFALFYCGQGVLLLGPLCFLAHRMMIASKYATLHPSEYDLLNNEKDPAVSNYYQSQIQILSTWNKYVSTTLEYEIIAAKKRTNTTLSTNITFGENQLQDWTRWLTLARMPLKCIRRSKDLPGYFTISANDVFYSMVGAWRSNAEWHQLKRANSKILLVLSLAISGLVGTSTFFGFDQPFSALDVVVALSTIICSFFWSLVYFNFLLTSTLDMQRRTTLARNLDDMIKVDVEGFILDDRDIENLGKLEEAHYIDSTNRSSVDEKSIGIDDRIEQTLKKLSWAPSHETVAKRNSTRTRTPLNVLLGSDSPNKGDFDNVDINLDQGAKATCKLMTDLNEMAEMEMGDMVMGLKSVFDGVEIPRIPLLLDKNNIFAWLEIRNVSREYASRWKKRLQLLVNVSIIIATISTFFLFAVTYYIRVVDTQKDIAHLLPIFAFGMFIIGQYYLIFSSLSWAIKCNETYGGHKNQLSEQTLHTLFIIANTESIRAKVITKLSPSSFEKRRSIRSCERFQPLLLAFASGSDSHRTSSSLSTSHIQLLSPHFPLTTLNFIPLPDRWVGCMQSQSNSKVQRGDTSISGCTRSIGGKPWIPGSHCQT